jgi:hypothetical protein
VGPESVSASDWQVLLYTAGRAMLWLVVISACTSMYGYFSSFYKAVVTERATERKTKSASVAVARDQVN